MSRKIANLQVIPQESGKQISGQMHRQKEGQPENCEQEKLATSPEQTLPGRERRR